MLMVLAGLFLAVVLTPPTPVEAQTAADAVTLRDGAVVLGVLAESPKGGGLALYARRERVRKDARDWAWKWETAEAPAARRPQSQRVARLAAWRRERAGTVEKADDHDPVLAWIDGELARLKDPDAWKSSPLVLLRPARGEIKSVRRAPGVGPTLLRLAWTAGLPDPEDLRLPDLKEALTGRGFDLSAAKPVLLDHLLPPQPETDASWTLRRAATEVTADSGLRFIRYQGLVLPEPSLAQPAGLPDLTAGLGTLKQLLGEDTGDPLPAKLREVAARGRVGATVTRLEIAEDFSVVAVEITLWVRQGAERWVPSGSRTSRVRPDDLAADAGKDLADDPQVGAAFQVVEALGLGRVTPELKRRSLNVGAATRKALGQARTDAGADLSALAFPIESGRGDVPRKADGR